jgi:2-hydroxychromene-2-carboxylate isomerase
MTTVYGDFSCPFSYLASLRIDALIDAGVEVEWRAVEHAPQLPVSGQRLDAAGTASMDAELRAVRKLLLPNEQLPLGSVTMTPHTQAAVSGYAEAVGAGVADEVRRLLFEAYWVRGLDIGNPDILRVLLAEPIKDGRSAAFPLHEAGFAVSANRGPITLDAYRRVREWRDAWQRTGTRTIPTVVCRGVSLSGVDALVWLAADMPTRRHSAA